MAEPIVRTFVIDTTQAEQNLTSLGATTTATTAIVDSLYTELIRLDQALNQLSPNDEQFQTLATQIKAVEESITSIETGKFADIATDVEAVSSAIGSVDASNVIQLNQSLSNIDTANAVTDIDNINNALSSIDASTAVTQVESVNNALDAVDTGNVTGQIENINTEFNNIDATNVTADLNEISTAIGGIDASNAVSEIGSIDGALSGIDTSEVVSEINNIGEAVSDINTDNITNVGSAVESVVAPVNNLTTATDQLNAELKDTKVDTSSIEQAGADFQELTVEQDKVTTSSKSLKAQLRELQAELANTEPDSAKYRELSQAAGELKDRIGDAAEAVGTQAGGAFERVGGSLGLVTSRIANLDFEGAAEGAKLLAQNITQIKPGDITKGIQGIGSALGSVGKALLTNPIFLIGAAIAAAIVYSEELLSLIDGVTDAETKVLDVQKERAALAKENYDNISATEETLKRQGYTEKQITALKVQALNTAILEQKAVVETTRIQAEGQIKAAERNAKYLKTFLDFVTFPQRKLAEFFQNFVNSSIDIINKLGFNIEKIDVTSIFEDVNNFVVKQIFDPEAERKNQEKIVADSQKTLDGLINQRDGILNTQAAKETADAKKLADDKLKIEEELNKQILDARRKTFEESQKLNKAIQKDAAKPIFGGTVIRNFDAEISAQRAAEEARIQLLAESQEKEIALVDQKYIRLRDQYKGNAEMLAKLTEANQREVNEIVAKGTKQQIQLNAESFQKGLEFAQQGLNALSDLTDVVFANKLSKVKKGSKEEEALAKKQFKFQKALQLGGATIDAAKAINASLASAPVAIGPLPNPAGIASLALAATTGAASIAKIAATKFEGGASAPDTTTPSIGGGGDVGGGAQPAQFNPLASSFLQDRPEQLTPRAYVLAGDVASQQEVREKVQDLARIG